MTVRTLTQGKPLPLILSVALPLMLGNIFQQLYTVTDAQIVGGVEGVDALAAIGAADWFNFLFLGVIQGLTQGFAIPMAQAFGAGEHPYLRRCIGNAITLSLLIMAAVTAGALLLIDPVLTVLETPALIRPASQSYLTVIFAAYPVTISYNLMAGILRALGDGRSPLWAMVIAALSNIGLDLLFVAVFGWGVMGAAVATAIAQVLACLFCLMRLRRISFIRPAKQDLHLQKAVALRLVTLGLPMAAQNAIIAIGGMAVQRIVNTMSVAFIAGYTATNKLYGVLEVAAISYGYAVSTYAGQNLGAAQPDRIRRGVRQAAWAGMATALVITAAMFLLGRAIITSFISGTPEEVAEATAIGCEFLYLMSAWLPVLYLLHNYRSALQGMGNTMMPLLSGLVELVMRVGAVLLLPALIGYRGVFWAEVLAWMGADAVLLPAYFLMLRRLQRNFQSLLPPHEC